MSVFAAPIVTFYHAPLGISASKVTVEGSWSAARFTGHMNSHVKFRMRLHTWKQQFESTVASACLDWIILNDKNILVLKLTNKNFASCLQNETFMNHIQAILDNSPYIYNVHNTISNYSQEI